MPSACTTSLKFLTEASNGLIMPRPMAVIRSVGFILSAARNRQEAANRSGQKHTRQSWTAWGAGRAVRGRAVVAASRETSLTDSNLAAEELERKREAWIFFWRTNNRTSWRGMEKKEIKNDFPTWGLRNWWLLMTYWHVRFEENRLTEER